MQTSYVLRADRGLTLTFDAAAHWRIGWAEPDWLGPVGLLVRHGNTIFAGGGPNPALDATRAQGTHSLKTSYDAFDGRDDLGDYRGVALRWNGLPLSVHTTVRAYVDAPLIVFRIEAASATHGLATGEFAHPSIAWPALHPWARCAGGVADGTRTYGHQYSEFALPVSGDASCTGFFFAPHRPAIVEPLLLIAPDGRTLMLAPLDHFHEQIIAVPKDRDAVRDGVACGWHGDLGAAPAGFATELALWAADGPRQALETWAGVLLRRHHTRRRSRYADDGVGKLSYWTDNGAYYYYRTEPGCDYSATLESVVADLHAQEIPVRGVQIDSWFYPHEQMRPVSAEGAPIVPPSGMMVWEPRADLFPEGFAAQRRRLGGLPLTFHSRHYSSRSPYFASESNGQAVAAWFDGAYAHPAESRLSDQLMAQAASWGAITYEQDWMVESFLGVRGLREQPGRARAWQAAMDRAADEHGLTLQWCMATPADFLQTVELENVTSIRTSGDYRYLFDNGLNWVWFLHTNALARALGLAAFKDTFISNADPSRGHADPYAEVEALLASLSTGPVAIGDQLGCANREIVMRTCREDGVLIKPDAPISAIDRCFHANAFLEPVPLIGETSSAHPAGRWVYVATFNACRNKQPSQVRVAFADLGTARPSGLVVLYDWRTRRCSRVDADGGWECTLEFQEWDYRVVCPLLTGNITVFGDVSKYATVGDRRVAGIVADEHGIHFDALGMPATWMEVHGYAARRPHAVTAWVPGESRRLSNEGCDDASREWWSWQPETGCWIVHVFLGRLGYARVSITPG